MVAWNGLTGRQLPSNPMSTRVTVSPDELHGPAFDQNPYAVWNRLQHDAPLFHDSIDDVWLLTRYDDVVAVLRDDVTYSTALYRTSFGKVIGDTFAQHDGERHARERRRVAPHLIGAKMRDRLAPIVRKDIGEVLGSLPPRLDLVGPFTLRLPGLVMADLFSAQGEERQRFVHLASAIAAGLIGTEPELTHGLAARRELEALADGWLAQRASGGARPDDLLEWLSAPDDQGHRLDRDYILTNVNFLAAAGTSTVDYALRNVLWALFAHPAIATAVEDGDGELMGKVFTETLRYAPPVPYEGRILTREVTLHGTTVPAGAIVRIGLASASSDESVFSRPRVFDPDRTDLWPGDSRAGMKRDGVASHLSFGLGSHFCAGYRLARFEAEEGVGALFRNLRPRLVGAVPSLRIYKYHWTVPQLEVELTRGSSSP